MIGNIKKYVLKCKKNSGSRPLFEYSRVADYYAFDGHKDIEGWLSAESLAIIKLLGDFQRRKNISGNVAEIGVFHGRFFVALCLMLNAGERGLAIDVFENQEFNLDHSGVGSYQKFIENIKSKLGTRRYVDILKSDSMKVNARAIHSCSGNDKFRLFSVDGCHTKQHTKHDLQLAAQVLSDDGVIILDDFQNFAWPEVKEGLVSFLETNQSIIPFAIAFNKLYLTTKNSLHDYLDYAKGISSRYADNLSFLNIGGNEVLDMVVPPPEHCFTDSFTGFFDFSTSHNQSLLNQGWFTPEAWGVWSEGTQKASITLPIIPKQSGNKLIIHVSFHAFVTKEFPVRKINVLVNSNLVDSLIFDYGMDYCNWSYNMVIDKVEDVDNLKLAFGVENPISPEEAGVSADTRKLGIGLRNIRFI